MTGTTTNTTQFPDVVWERYKSIAPENSNLSDALTDTVARDVLENDDELSPEEREAIKRHIIREDRDG